MKDFARTQNTIVAFYWEYSRYHYLYFIIGKQWNKDLLNNNKEYLLRYQHSRGKGNDRNYV